jgi:sugar lactone lactonase YvrE
MKRIFILLLILCTLSACSATKVPDEIIVVFDNLYPEGIEYDENGERFLLGSSSEGAIFQVFDDGTIEPIIEDPDLYECVGIEIDRKNQRLLVANNDKDENKNYLNSYDLVTGERIFMAEISSIKPDLYHIVNDIAVDTNGNAYVTDTYSPAIYRVDMDGNPTLFMEHSQFEYLNGIVYHPNGFLLLGAYPNLLLKIPIDNPDVIKVDISGGNLYFDVTDGMIMHPDGSLIMVTFPGSKVHRVQSEDNWESAQSVGKSSGHTDGYGTTLALRGEEVYVIYSHVDRYFDGLDQSKFEIVRVIFE